MVLLYVPRFFQFLSFFLIFCATKQDVISPRDFQMQDEIGCSNSQQCSVAAANEEANSSLSSFRPSKQARRTAEEDRGQADSRSTAVVSAVHGFQKQMVTNDADAATTVLGIYQLSRGENR